MQLSDLGDSSPRVGRQTRKQGISMAWDKSQKRSPDSSWYEGCVTVATGETSQGTFSIPWRRRGIQEGFRAGRWARKGSLRDRGQQVQKLRGFAGYVPGLAGSTAGWLYTEATGFGEENMTQVMENAHSSMPGSSENSSHYLSNNTMIVSLLSRCLLPSFVFLVYLFIFSYEDSNNLI